MAGAGYGDGGRTGLEWNGMSLKGRADYDGLASEGVWVVSGSWAGGGFRSMGSFSLGVLLGRKVSPFHRTLRKYPSCKCSIYSRPWTTRHVHTVAGDMRESYPESSSISDPHLCDAKSRPQRNENNRENTARFVIPLAWWPSG